MLMGALLQQDIRPLPKLPLLFPGCIKNLLKLSMFPNVHASLSQTFPVQKIKLLVSKEVC